MSTRALYTFKGETDSNTWNVYKHHDGYPRGAAHTLQDTLDYFAWRLPRYEADEFACAFIAAGKADYFVRAVKDKTAKERKDALLYVPGGKYAMQGGGVRMMPQGAPMQIACEHCSDIEYRYEIYQGNKQELRVRAFVVSVWDSPGSETLLTDCPIGELAAWAAKMEAQSA